MPSIRPNPNYNNPNLAAGFESLAAAFGPPDPNDLVSYASAAGLRQKNDIIEKLRSDPRYAGADAGVLADLFDPTGSWAAQEQNTATARRGQDITASTSRANNAADNQRAFTTTMFGPLDQGQVRPDVPEQVTGLFGLNGPLPGVTGAPKPLSETEWKAGELQRLLDQGTVTDADIATQYRSGTNIEEVLGPDGKTPLYVSRDAAIGMTPAPKSPLVNIGPNGEPLGNPGDGLVWQRDAGGNIAFDERGAPIAIPYQGGKVYEDQQRRAEAGAAADLRSDTKGNVVVQDVDRAIQKIEQSPLLTTGVGAQLTSGAGGSPAFDVQALVDTVKANIGFEELQAMREASPTGGALGNITEREIAYLQATVGNLDPRQSKDQIVENLKRVKNAYLDVIHGPGSGPARESLSFDAQPAPEATATNPATGQRLVLRNGQWLPAE